MSSQKHSWRPWSCFCVRGIRRAVPLSNGTSPAGPSPASSFETLKPELFQHRDGLFLTFWLRSALHPCCICYVVWLFVDKGLVAVAGNRPGFGHEFAPKKTDILICFSKMLQCNAVRKNNVPIHLLSPSLRPVHHLTGQRVQGDPICKSSLFGVKYWGEFVLI